MRHLTNQEISDLLRMFEHQPGERYFKFYFMLKGIRDDLGSNNLLLSLFDIAKVALMGVILWRVW